MTCPPISKFRVPHWGWFLLGAAVLGIGGIALSISLRIDQIDRQQQIVQMLEGWGGRVGAETGSPWLGQPGADHGITLVNLSGTAISDGEIARFSALTNPDTLFLDRTGVTDAGLASLSQLTNLRRLSLTNTQVTDAGLPHLVALTNLRILDIRGTAATNNGVEEIKKLLPDCAIIR